MRLRAFLPAVAIPMAFPAVRAAVAQSAPGGVDLQVTDAESGCGVVALRTRTR